MGRLAAAAAFAEAAAAAAASAFVAPACAACVAWSGVVTADVLFIGAMFCAVPSPADLLSPSIGPIPKPLSGDAALFGSALALALDAALGIFAAAFCTGGAVRSWCPLSAASAASAF
ncbi:hypothetical protein LMG29739_06272 [Paraburkholderia solisilvae]|uniref:Uncharacterized protein n=1 Tax=Paraburkholderia solisilvae TaxID=624376 RepID=A0A6J5F5L0_9BURK|nr:hypothetical protein LMG29739_06272 [Paraburkholderia solisilvae]